MPIAAPLLLIGLLAQGDRAAPEATDPVGRAYYFFLEGLTFDANDDFGGAIASYRQAAALLPRVAAVRAELAGLYLRQGQLDEARAEALAALAVDPENRDAHRVVGWAQSVEVGRSKNARPALVTEAVGHLERALANGAGDPAAELALGAMYVRQRDTAKAIARLRGFLDAQPDYPPAMRLLAEAYQFAGQISEANTLIERLPQVTPDVTETVVRQIQRLQRAGQWEAAAEGWAEVIDQDPGQGMLYRTSYALALLNVGDADKARTVLEDVTRQTPKDPMPWFLLSRVEAAAGHGDAADAAARTFQALDPGDPRGVLALAQARATLKDFKGAVSALETRVESGPASDFTSGYFSEMVRELSAAYASQGKKKEAVDVVDRAMKRQPENVDLRFMLGAAAEQNGDVGRAETAFRGVISSNPQHALALNYLGYMLADHGQKLPEAVELIKRALAIDTDNPSYLDSLGWAYFKMGQFEDARGPLEHAAAAVPSASVILEHLGDLYVRLNRPADAVAAFDRALSGDRDGIDVGALTQKRDRAKATTPAAR